MSNKEKIDKIEEMIKETAKLRNEDETEALKSFSDTLDEIYLRFKVMLEGLKELKGEADE